MNIFNLEKAKQGEPVITRDGKSVRIICFDRKFNVNGKDGSIIAWYTGSKPYQVYIASDRTIYANKMKKYLPCINLEL